jgi:hypothetical protein
MFHVYYCFDEENSAYSFLIETLLYLALAIAICAGTKNAKAKKKEWRRARHTAHCNNITLTIHIDMFKQ